MAVNPVMSPQYLRKPLANLYVFCLNNKAIKYNIVVVIFISQTIFVNSAKCVGTHRTDARPYTVHINVHLGSSLYLILVSTIDKRLTFSPLTKIAL